MTGIFPFPAYGKEEKTKVEKGQANHISIRRQYVSRNIIGDPTKSMPTPKARDLSRGSRGKSTRSIFVFLGHFSRSHSIRVPIMLLYL